MAFPWSLGSAEVHSSEMDVLAGIVFIATDMKMEGLWQSSRLALWQGKNVNLGVYVKKFI